MEYFKDIEWNAWNEWLKSKACNDAIAVTITFRGATPISFIGAQQAMRIYSRMLNKLALGKRFTRGEAKLTWIAVREGGESVDEKRVHYHLIIEKPQGWSYEGWMRAAKERAAKIDCFSRQQICIKRVRDDGWLDYILKKKDKRSFTDAIDVANLWVN